MTPDFEETVRAAGSALTDHRLLDARRLLGAALDHPTVPAIGGPLQAALTVNAAALAQTTGDFSAAVRFGRRLQVLPAQTDGVRLNHAWYRLRQTLLQGPWANAMQDAGVLLRAAESTTVEPVQRAEVVAELAGFQAAGGQVASAIALYDRACVELDRSERHRSWLAEALFEQARLLVLVWRGGAERQVGHLTALVAEVTPAADEARRRARVALAHALDRSSPDTRSGPLGQSIVALLQVVDSNGGTTQAQLAAFSALAAHYRTHGLCELAVWSGCELARLLVEASCFDQALQAVAQARTALPAQGFQLAREELDYTESLAHRARGDYKHALFAYQRYAERVNRRRLELGIGAPPAQAREAADRLLAKPRVVRSVPSAPRLPAASAPATPAAPTAAMQGLLTARERDVLAHVRLGKTNLDIARALGISANTVRNHLAAACRKLNVDSREAAAERAGEA
jgi:DNA-binding CsgD family transcriptional regulator